MSDESSQEAIGAVSPSAGGDGRPGDPPYGPDFGRDYLSDLPRGNNGRSEEQVVRLSRHCNCGIKVMVTVDGMAPRELASNHGAHISGECPTCVKHRQDGLDRFQGDFCIHCGVSRCLHGEA